MPMPRPVRPSRPGSSLLASCSLVAGLLVAACSCAQTTRAPAANATAAAAAAATDGASAKGLVRGAPRSGKLAWAELTPETLARAKAERKFVVLDGAAEWCHWCHVMEAETYHDPRVQALLGASFIAIKVDVDSRPDIEERYGDWGWPATVIFSPDGAELGKYRGFIDADRFLEILNDVVAQGDRGGPETGQTKLAATPLPQGAGAGPISEEQLGWIERMIEVELEEYWDPEEGSWGKRQKSPIGSTNAWLLGKAARGDAEARRRITFTLDQQAQLIDPVWGGIYQYSTDGVWTEPHFEKLMPYQAGALENYARAYQLFGDPKHLARAKAMHGYLDRFLKSPQGGFYCTQDADLNAHAPDKPYMTGHDYYAKPEAERLALGLPRIDTHEYGKDNGLAIAAYVTMYEVTRDRAVLAAAERAAQRMIDTHADPRGGITHDERKPQPPKPEVLYLSDNAAFGMALIRLHEATNSATNSATNGAKRAEYLAQAQALAAFLLKDLRDDKSGGLFAHTEDPSAMGVFTARRVPFEDNVMALRFLARLAKVAPSHELVGAIDGILRALAKPDQIKARGRFIGDFLLALEETKSVRGAAGKARVAAATPKPR
jgi:uncharacterized protein